MENIYKGELLESVYKGLRFIDGELSVKINGSSHGTRDSALELVLGPLRMEVNRAVRPCI